MAVHFGGRGPGHMVRVWVSAIATALFTVLSSGGSSYSTSRTVLASDGTSYTVPQAVLSSGGTSYSVI